MDRELHDSLIKWICNPSAPAPTIPIIVNNEEVPLYCATGNVHLYGRYIPLQQLCRPAYITNSIVAAAIPDKKSMPIYYVQLEKTHNTCSVAFIPDGNGLSFLNRLVIFHPDGAPLHYTLDNSFYIPQRLSNLRNVLRLMLRREIGNGYVTGVLDDWNFFVGDYHTRIRSYFSQIPSDIDRILLEMASLEQQ